MLNHSRVLAYIKDFMGFPHVHLELTDKQIIQRFVTYTLREFSEYIPDVKKIPLNFNDKKYKVPNIQNEFYIKDPDNIEILNVVDVYFDGTDNLITGAPIFGPMSHYEIREWALAESMSKDLKQFSSFDKTFEFRTPNILRISPVPTTGSFCTVEYERMQPEDMRGIPNEHQILFCKLALADTMIQIGRIRKKYGGQIRTPFGEIPLNDEVGDEGKELKRECIEKMERLFLPNVSVDFG
jgi:hypothetical protein